jgi:hypothetical protein
MEVEVKPGTNRNVCRTWETLDEFSTRAFVTVSGLERILVVWNVKDAG